MHFRENSTDRKGAERLREGHWQEGLTKIRRWGNLKEKRRT
jgi:hypothetical protein